MKRRKAIAQMGLGITTIISFPAWASGWNRLTLKNARYLEDHESDTLTAMVDTIIPKTDTPGAKELGVPELIQKIVKDCYDPKSQAAFASSLFMTDAVALSKYGDSFIHLNGEQQSEVLKSMAGSEYPDQKNALNTIKQMTIEGYTKSEYYMQNVSHFEMAPNRYIGCVTLKI